MEKRQENKSLWLKRILNVGNVVKNGEFNSFLKCGRRCKDLYRTIQKKQHIMEVEDECNGCGLPIYFDVKIQIKNVDQ